MTPTRPSVLNSADVRHVKFKLASAKALKKTHGWTWIGVTLTREKVTLYENCEKPVEIELVHSPLLRFPSDALVYFRQEPGLKRKFVGSVQVARLYSNRITFAAVEVFKCWHCKLGGMNLAANFQRTTRQMLGQCDGLCHLRTVVNIVPQGVDRM
ncbi:hypothetical protein MTO96_035251 [Rhipicephalus appendiculatus]